MFQKIKLQFTLLKSKKPKKFWLASVFSFVLGLAMTFPKMASAAFIEKIASAVLLKPIVILADLLAWIGSQLVILEGTIIDWLVNNSQFTKLAVVQTGWGIARDISNLFFIGVLIYIAFGVILRLEKFNASKLIFQLVLIAILINFSLMISGIIIDFSQALFKFFVFAPIQGDVDLSPQLANALKLQSFWDSGQGIAGTADSFDYSFGQEIMRTIGKLFVTVIFTFITVIVFGAMIVMLFIRNIYLWILLILAPLAWFCKLIPVPKIKGLASQWWDKFLQWAFMAPIMGFFIFLTLLTAMGREALTRGFATTANSSDLFSGNFSAVNIFQFLAVIGMMVGGLGVSASMGNKAAQGALGIINKTGKGVKGYMSRKTTQGVGWAGGGALAGISKGVGKIPLVGGLLSKPIGVAGRNLEAKGYEAQQEEIKKANKRIEGMTLGQLNKDFSTLTQNEKTAAIEKAMKAGKMPENMKDTAMTMAAERSKKGDTNFDKELLKIDPTLRSDWQPTIRQITKLEDEKKGLRDEGAIKIKQEEIDKFSASLQDKVTETLKGLKSTEVAKTLATVMDNEKISGGVKKAFVEYAANLNDNNTVMNITGKITELPQKVSFVSTLLKMRENRAVNTQEPLEKQKLEDRNARLVKTLLRNAGIRETDFWETLLVASRPKAPQTAATGEPEVPKTAEENAKANPSEVV
ncbi:MAG TPA: hypothetical protein P5524_01665 [Candidatus Paceibacterota bacterium]|nr:hypothetical protein [Candidatus Paceibacterota bacterium]